MYEYIEFVICYGESLTPELVKEKTRKGNVMFARQLIMYFCKEKEEGTLQQIGDHFGLDHATVLHAIKTIKNYIETDKIKRIKIEYYTKLIDKILVLAAKGNDIKKKLAPLEKEISQLETRVVNLSVQLMFLKSGLNKNDML